MIILYVRAQASRNELPYFKNPPRTLRTKENMKGSLFDFEAVGPETEKITMFLDSVGEDLFEIVDNFGNDNATGFSPLMRKLRLKKPLDREAHGEYAFYIGVKDYVMSTARESKHHVKLYVEDENDNKPIFLKTPYFRSIFENSPSNDLYNISASDADIGTSGKFSFFFTDECKLDDCQFFDINAATGHVKLKTNETLDYEKRNHYNLGILVKDHGVPSLNSTTNLVIEVKDQSDQPPVFEKSSYRADIDENIAKDSVVIQTRAFDGDRGIKNPVIYSIVAGNHNYHFRIDNSSGKIYVNSSIDRDNGDDYFELTVEATEIPDKTTGDAVVFVTIRDLNDNKPTFPTEGFLYSTNIPENTPIGTTIFFRMGAYDNDREARNAKFQYSMLCDHNGTFTIDPIIGRIALNKSVDYEMKKNYTILVIATETDSVEKYSSNQTVFVIITNINDNNPVFNQSQYNLSVNEGDVVGTNIGQIMASDNDAGYYGDVTYSLIGNGADMFLVDKENGTISVARSLDYESRTLFYIGLQAKDGGNKITEVTLIISIIDNNDNPPIFNPSTPKLHSLRKMKDMDFILQFRYYIMNGNLLKNFTINNITGNITNSGIIDYETKSEFTLVVMAKDQGIPPLNSTKSIVIFVKDKNDNTPYFNQTFYNLSLVENVGIDFPLVQLHAFDKDNGLNAELVYTIVDGNNEKMFTINIDGLVLTRSSPNREKTSFYILNVSVSDSGDPKMFAYTTLIVQILDENDNTPEFSMIVDKIQIKEGPSTINSTVVNNTAVDNDLGLNGTVEYTIADGNSEGKFHIDSHTGEISVAKELDFETVRLYSLKIVATDKGTPRMLSGEYQLVVELLDINDNSPRFGQPEYSFTVTENRPPGTHIVYLRADDRDSEKNKLITYSFSNGNIGFALVINNETGEISTSRPLDREKVSQYFLTVKAIDHGKPSLQGRTNVTINVLDVNDVIPNFNKSSYSASVPEDTTKGTSIDCIVQAVDMDDGPAGAVTYELESEGNIEDGNHVFSIGSITGEVKTATSLNFEKRRNFTVTVTACDNGVPRLCSNVSLYVTITDTDDNAPAFAQDTWSATVNENVSLGVNITQIIATDDDFELHHRKIYYFITDGNEDEVFGIGFENGSVYVANTKNLDRERKDKYELTVVARTLNKFMNKTVQETSAKLTIVVLDYNDNAPVFRQNTYRKKIPESFELNEEILTVSAVMQILKKTKESRILLWMEMLTESSL
ncbi:protocadherin Fat 4-like [Xenia sp. Carnegie-2017]|uniref:protocadherin Fat 4-like n=1 Tax=Xenia sp. Carnegie-2017 TaxID=2897299 RepID=UPI001F03AE0D|nr:protocadherin Fat 4-like [Xenia sp. Carnegie-2017]